MAHKNTAPPKTRSRKKSSRRPRINLLPAIANSENRATTKKRWWKWPAIIIGFLAIGYVLLLTAGFFALRWHVTDVAGTIDPRTEEFTNLAESTNLKITSLPVIANSPVSEVDLGKRQFACQLAALAKQFPADASNIQQARNSGADDVMIKKMLFAAMLQLDPHPTTKNAVLDCADPVALMADTELGGAWPEAGATVYPWARTEEWGIIKEAFAKDAADINRAASAAGVNPRLIVAVGMVEQLRLYFTQRELYEKFFRPLKILGNATQLAWGVMSIKEKMAIRVEDNLIQPRSPYYLGIDRSALLLFSTADALKERLERLTNEREHYYSYLYAGLALAQLEKQWQRAGFPVGDRPEIMATLYNIGFNNSRPKANPQVGGSTITIGDIEYTFGGLAFEFYYSGELQDLFPIK